MCKLAGLSADIARNAIPVHPYTERASRALGFDPLRLVASGSMMAVVPRDREPLALAAFAGTGISVTCVGCMTASGEAPAEMKMACATEELWGLLERERPVNTSRLS